MVPQTVRFRHVLLILLLILLPAALPVFASAAEIGAISASSDHVDEGDYIILNTNMTGIVTWTSSNSSIATISSTGLVTGIQAGQVTITASCNGYTTASLSLWVTVPDGIYYIKNASSGHCMQTTEDTTYVHTQNTSQEGRINQLWKIAYISNGNYVIRPLRDFSVAMTAASSGYVAVADAQMSDSSVPSNMYWKIVHTDYGYAFKHGGSDSKTAMPIVNGATGVPVYPSSWTPSYFCHWNLEEAFGVFLRNTTTKQTLNTSSVKYLRTGNSAIPGALGLTVETYGNRSSQSWSSGDTSIATINTSGAVTARSIGETTITYRATIGGVQYSASYTVLCFIPVNVEVVYDNGYSSKYSDASNRINSQLAAIQDLYLNDFYIQIVCNSSQPFASYADQCPRPYNQNCNCGRCVNTIAYTTGNIHLENYHHKNYYNMFFRITPPTNPNTYKIAYTGHNVCSYDGLFCTRETSNNNSLLGVTFYGYNILLVTHDIAPATEVVTVAHEFGHFFGAPDHYGGYNTPTTDAMNDQYVGYGFSSNCMYGELYRLNANTLTSLAICPGCRRMIQDTAREMDNE